MNTAVTRRVSAQRVEDLLRLADQGERKGIRILLTEDGAHFATSASDKTRLHRVSPDGCDCRGYQAWHRCMHHSLLLSQLGLIPDPAPAVTEVVVLDEQPAPCRSCRGAGYVRAYVGGGLSDWIPVPCGCREVAPAA
ncbi:MAG: hypothetical protein M3R02_20695 [Chloroflexota bacterium]|nr:hypothetical protein [Chloroflexota bacterium]